ncbi:MAG: hypothetical protein R3C69_13545 [Geminicoccaceae bacterium]
MQREPERRPRGVQMRRHPADRPAIDSRIEHAIEAHRAELGNALTARFAIQHRRQRVACHQPLAHMENRLEERLELGLVRREERLLGIVDLPPEIADAGLELGEAGDPGEALNQVEAGRLQLAGDPARHHAAQALGDLGGDEAATPLRRQAIDIGGQQVKAVALDRDVEIMRAEPLRQAALDDLVGLLAHRRPAIAEAQAQFLDVEELEPAGQARRRQGRMMAPERLDALGEATLMPRVEPVPGPRRMERERRRPPLLQRPCGSRHGRRRCFRDGSIGHCSLQHRSGQGQGTGTLAGLVDAQASNAWLRSR